MLDQLVNIVKQLGQHTVVSNPEVPNEHNQEVMADATQTIAGGFKNIMAGGGLQNILDLFKGGGNSSVSTGSGIGGLLKNPIVTMMVGHFISKLVGKYNMSPSAASNVANDLIPGSLDGLIKQTQDPGNSNLNMDGFLGSLIGNNAGAEQDGATQKTGGSPLQDLLDKFTGGVGDTNGDGKADLQDLIGKFTQRSQNSLQGQGQGGGGGLLDMIKGFM
ncbi:MAG TPA: hypothetical protein VGO58_18240 [Chitinophagaceae bacterium]|jgi:hypothetical protein|nr:hypothetical protein [Chitinophagaceae bacterium]